jgi:hypothetical protein
MSCAGSKGLDCPDSACAEMVQLRNRMLVGLRSLRADALYKRRNGLHAQATDQLEAAATLSGEIFTFESRIVKRLAKRDLPCEESAVYGVPVAS